MTDKLTSALDVYGVAYNDVVARISLNGYDIEAGGVFPDTGAMRSFVLVEGDLWDQWHMLEAVTLVNEHGIQVPVRIAALPVEETGHGLIEFL